MPRSPLTAGMSSSARASTDCPRPGTWPGNYGPAAAAAARTSASSTRAGVGAGASGIAVRRGPQQLLPACDARADGPFGVGVGVATPRRSPIIRSATCRSRRRRCTRDVANDLSEQQEIGYPSVLIEGEPTHRYLTDMFADWQAHGHHDGPAREEGRVRQQHRVGARPGREGGAEASGSGPACGSPGSQPRGGGHRGRDRPGARSRATRSWSGPARGSRRSVGLAGPAQDDQRRGPGRDRGSGRGRCGPTGPAGGHARRRPSDSATNGAMPPVIHVDTDAPLYRRRRRRPAHRSAVGHLLQAGFQLRRAAGRRMPYKIERAPGQVAVDPYGPESPEFVAADNSSGCGPRRWLSATSASRVSRSCTGKSHRRHRRIYAGLFPGLRPFRENCYVIADSNHGYKMIGVGELVAREIPR